MTSNIVRTITALAVLVALTSCSQQPSTAPTAETGQQTPVTAAPVTSDTMLIDVRSAEEFSAGHLAGAVNIDVNDPEFDTRIAALDPNRPYLLYCRSGNRSAQAAERMRQGGFVDLTDLGSVEEAAEATGIEIVR